jgi:hypothetical protein
MIGADTEKTRNCQRCARAGGSSPKKTVSLCNFLVYDTMASAARRGLKRCIGILREVKNKVWTSVRLTNNSISYYLELQLGGQSVGCVRLVFRT